MKKHIIEFIKRGLMASSGGPIVVSIVYFILGKAGVISSLAPDEIALGMISSALLAFIVGGISMIYTVDRLSTFIAALIHGVTLYAVYISIYLINGWIKSQLTAISIFTAAFVVGYAIIWLIIYISVRNSAKKLNSKLKSKRD